MKFLITYLFLLLFGLGYSQEKGSLFLRVYPKNAIIKLNDSLLKSLKAYPLDTGTYVVKIWQSKREYVEKTINIKSGKTTQLLEVLSYTHEYKVFKRKRFMYHANKSLLRYGSPIILGWFVQNSLSTLNDLDDRVTKFYDLSISAKNEYNSGVEKNYLQSRKEVYEIYREAYEESLVEYNETKKNRMMVGSALIISVAIAEYFSFKLKKPTYEEKVLLSNFYIDKYNNEWTPSFSLAYKF